MFEVLVKYENDSEVVKVNTPDEIEQVLKDLPIQWVKKQVYDKITEQRKYKYILNLPISFDIETSSWYEDIETGKQYTNDEANSIFSSAKNGVEEIKLKEKIEQRACMYCWQMAFGTDDRIIFGRTWQDFIDVLATLKSAFNLDDTHLMYIYVHNLAYEFQWIRPYFSWKDSFCLDQRKVVTAETSGVYYEDPDFPRGFGLADFSGFMFRCSYILAGVKEEILPKLMTKYSNKCKKLVGYLDYDKIRHQTTDLTNDEISYCINDVRLVNWYIQERIEEDGSIAKILLTKTGYVRKYVREKCFYSDTNINKSKKDSKYINYKRLLDSMKMDLATYYQLRSCYQGGFTHSSHLKSGNSQVWENVGSWDIASSYPTVMVCEKFPMSKFELIKTPNKKEMLYYLNNNACLFNITIKGLREKYISRDLQMDFEHILSLNKCQEFANVYGHEYDPVGYDLDNGRIINAQSVSFTCNEVDFFMIKKFYDYDKIQISNFRIATKNYLPTDFVKCILELFKQKTEYKVYDNTGKPEEMYYKRAKEHINSLYGMTVTDILKKTWGFNEVGVWDYIHETEEQKAERLDDTLDSSNNFLFYAWGVWITSYARKNLFSAIINSGYRHCYSDTDSEKALYDDSLQKFFDEYNSNIDIKMNEAFKYHKLPADSHKASYIKNGKTITKCLGYFEFEGFYTKFATCGAKRYIVEKDGEIKITVAGLPKSCVSYLKDTYKDDLFTTFANCEIKVPREYTNKLLATYIDNSTKGNVIDYLGNTGEYAEVSSLHLDKVGFDMSMSDEYKELLLLDSLYNKIGEDVIDLY